MKKKKKKKFFFFFFGRSKKQVGLRNYFLIMMKHLTNGSVYDANQITTQQQRTLMGLVKIKSQAQRQGVL